MERRTIRINKRWTRKNCGGWTLTFFKNSSSLKRLHSVYHDKKCQTHQTLIHLTIFIHPLSCQATCYISYERKSSFFNSFSLSKWTQGKSRTDVFHIRLQICRWEVRSTIFFKRKVWGHLAPNPAFQLAYFVRKMFLVVTAILHPFLFKHVFPATTTCT